MENSDISSTMVKVIEWLAVLESVVVTENLMKY